MNEAATAEPAQAIEPQRREAWWVRHYTFTGTAVGLVFIWFSMTPSLLPRGPLFQGLVSGLAARVVPADDLLTEAKAVATTISQMSLSASRMAKEAVNRAFESTLTEGLLYERRLFHSAFATDDQSEGMAAFIEKRAPNFTHR